ncbi:MAG: hypothetical protein V2A65_03735 [Candidatus Omnitrophota bacterium]
MKKAGILFGIFLLISLSLAKGVYSQGQRGSGPGGSPGGPMNDETFGAVSDNGLDFTILPGPFFEHASVPDVLEFSKDGPAGKAGTLLLYFVDFSEARGPGTETISMATSTDGTTWSEKEPIVLAGKRNQGATVDPSVIELPDGRIRMYFFGSEMTGGDPAMVPGDHKIYSAISGDGIHFKVEEGVRFQSPSTTDPDVVRSGSEWFMVLSKGRDTLLARSNDGLTFNLDRDFILSFGGVPGAVMLPGGKIRIFVCGREGILSALFDPGTGTISEEGTRIKGKTGGLVADPSPIQRRDGSYYLIFKNRKNSPRKNPERKPPEQRESY